MSYSKIFSVESFMDDPEKIDLQIQINMKDATWKQFKNIMDLYRSNKDVTIFSLEGMSGSATLSYKVDKDKHKVSWKDEYYLD